MPEGVEAQSSTVECQNPTVHQQLKAEGAVSGSGTWRALPDTSEEKPAGKNGKLQLWSRR